MLRTSCFIDYLPRPLPPQGIKCGLILIFILAALGPPEVAFGPSPVVANELRGDTEVLTAGTLVIAQSKDHGPVPLLDWEPLGSGGGGGATTTTTTLHADGAVLGSVIGIPRDDEIRDVAVERGGDLALRGRDGAHVGVHGLVGELVAMACSAQYRPVDGPVVEEDVGVVMG